MRHTHATSQPCTCHRASHTWLKVLLALALLSLVLAATAHAQNADAAPDDASQMQQQRPAGRVIRLSYVEGDVQLLAPNQANFDHAVANMPLTEGTQVQTGSGGKAEMQFEDGSLVRVVPGSQLELAQLSGGNAGDLATTIELRSGVAYFEVNPSGNGSFIVNAGSLSVSVPDHASFRVDLTTYAAQIAVADGYVSVTSYGTQDATRLNADQTASLGEAGMTVTAGTATEPYDQWNEDRDNLLNQQAASTTGVQQGTDDSGWNDLDYYGNWYSVPGVGQVWQPYGYDAGWGPYDAGYWAYYPWGYAWVSAYPWGWTPFHCGYWNYYDGFGWGWVGGGCGIDIWYPIAPVTRGPEGWRYPRRPLKPLSGPMPVHRLQPVGTTQYSPLMPAPAHPAPRNGTPRSVTINGHTVQPLPAAPRTVKPGLPAGTREMPPQPTGAHGGRTPWRGVAPPAAPRPEPRVGNALPPHSAPSRSAPPPSSHSSESSHSEPSHSDNHK